MKACIIVTLFACFLVFRCKERQMIVKANVEVTYDNGQTEILDYARYCDISDQNNTPYRLENGCLVYYRSSREYPGEALLCGVRKLTVRSYNSYEVK